VFTQIAPFSESLIAFTQGGSRPVGVKKTEFTLLFFTTDVNTTQG
jgi:hypothetical protein